MFIQKIAIAEEHLLCQLTDKIIIDQVWAGTKVGYDAVENKQFIYMAYYDAERWLTIAQYNKCLGTLNKVKLPSQFTGWDAHNYITMTFDNDGHLHVVGNMHASALVYARMSHQDNLESLATLQAMTNQLEDLVTYPKFFKFNDNQLGFMYRHGGSGNGVEIINRFENNTWQRWLDQPLFAPSSEKSPVNAYHTGFIKGADEVFHIAWVWRSNSNVETNFNVNYAKSPDLKSWFNSTGETLTLPITPDSNVMVDLISHESGLFNNIKLGFDLNNLPVISYIKFDNTGNSQLYHARFKDEEWQILSTSNWNYRWNPQGGGTIPAVISFSGIMQNNNQLIENVRHDQYGSMTFIYDNDCLIIKETSTIPNMQNSINSANENHIINVKAIKSETFEHLQENNNHKITWSSYPANNRDSPRNCETVPCNLTSDLLLEPRVNE